VRRYRVEKAGRWVQPVRKGYLMQCCDCALVHRMDFRIVSDESGYSQRVQFRAWRAAGETKAQRTKRRIRVRTT
jgi:Zn-finger protein